MVHDTLIIVSTTFRWWKGVNILPMKRGFKSPKD